MITLNNRLILEQYIKEGLRAKIQGGIATPGQRDGLKGLKVLVDAVITVDGNSDTIPAGSIAYIREEVLHTHQWASKVFNCDKIPEKFMIVELTYVEFFDLKENNE